MIASLDGGATADGKSGGLAGPGDRAMFTLMRQLADVILVGAGTVRTENYSGAQFSPAQRQARRRRGQAEVPPIAVVTNRGDLRPRRQDLHPHRGAAADPHLCRRGRRHPRAGSDRWPRSSTRRARTPTGSTRATVLKILADRGLFRVLAEGGPQILGLLIQRRSARRAVPDRSRRYWSAAPPGASPPAPARCTPRCGAATCSPTMPAICTRATSGRR